MRRFIASLLFFPFLVFAGTYLDFVAPPAGGGGLVLEDHNTNSGTYTDIPLTKPGGASVNDLYALIGSDPTNTSWTAPTDWIAIVQDNVQGCNVNAAYRIVDGTEAATIDYGNGSSTKKVGSYLWVSGNATTGVINAQNAIASGSISPHTIASITTTVAGTKAFYVAGFDGGDGSPFAITSGADWTEKEDVTTGTFQSDAAMTWGVKDVTAAGSTGDVEITASAADGLCTFQFAIAPL